MKKVILTIATIGMSLTGIAQDKYVVSALTSLKEQNYDDAKENIDKAMASPETNEKPKALFAKVQIYYQMQNLDKYKASNPYREGSKALFKLIEVKPDYERTTVDQLLLATAYLYYNDGVKAYNDKKLTESTEDMNTVLKIHNMDGGKRFEKSPNAKNFDTVAAGANQIMATSSYYLSNYDEAIPLLTMAKNNPITKTPSVYECLIDSYNKKNKTADAQATIEEARKAFPDDQTIRNYELNSLITSGKQDELIKKLEEAAAKEPTNADIQFNLATVYLQMANPKGGKKPANTAELTAKSEEAYRQAIKLDPDNAGYNYNFGALYYNEAIDVNSQMNDITGTTEEDTKKYDGLKTNRDAIFGKAMPYFEKAYDVLSKNENNLKGEDWSTYKSTMLALKEIYARQNKMDKSQEISKKYDALNTKK
jgi:Tfp pilus assembly protein PilF